ncbi:MAG TPA: dephospho-CoA kinase [Pseudomonadales bacterium]|nr:dephospho-CoA kinase [Pseudomonadales bacterium]MDP6316058.1 dephospho-CoA kinase [Pseudomonadales bacterium]MDP7313947.1 dephospho-CoA kinase [Pseudomonadales bacterium]HJL61837.1 dephospho-CoA kinase [Pseudomonadales bacterium]
MMVFVVGLTGGIGSGKTAVSDRFGERGITIADADVAARVVVEPGTQALEKISQHFGSDVLENGELNRAALREIVFSNATERRWLESVTVPAILQELRRILDYALSPYAILMLSSGSGRSPWIDRRLVIDVSPEVQIERVATRDSNTPEQIRAIMKTQPSREERLKYADDVIVNDGDFSQLDREITQLHQQYLNLAEQ